MRWTTTGTLRDGAHLGTLSVTWDDGDLSGDDRAVRWVRVTAREREARGGVGFPTGPFFDGDLLSQPLAAALVIDSVFVPGYAVSGDVPALSPGPGGEKVF